MDCMCESQIWRDYQKSIIFGISFCTMKLNDLKMQRWVQWVFFRCKLFNKRCISRLFVQHKHLPYMQSNCDLVSAKIKQSIILVHHANYQIRNAPCNDRKMNDLRRPFRYLISRRHARRKFVYHVHVPIVAVYIHCHVALDTYIHIDDIYRHVRLMSLSRLQHTIRWKS